MELIDCIFIVASRKTKQIAYTRAHMATRWTRLDGTKGGMAAAQASQRSYPTNLAPQIGSATTVVDGHFGREIEM